VKSLKFKSLTNLMCFHFKFKIKRNAWVVHLERQADSIFVKFNIDSTCQNVFMKFSFIRDYLAYELSFKYILKLTTLKSVSAKLCGIM
jgi:hypothetical protein